MSIFPLHITLTLITVSDVYLTLHTPHSFRSVPHSSHSSLSEVYLAPSLLSVRSVPHFSAPHSVRRVPHSSQCHTPHVTSVITRAESCMSSPISTIYYFPVSLLNEEVFLLHLYNRMQSATDQLFSTHYSNYPFAVL